LSVTAPPSPAWQSVLRVGRRLLGGRQMNHLVRFEPLLTLISQVGDGGTLLDVGSGSLGIASLLGSNWHCTSLDADFEDYGASLGAPVSSASHLVGDVRALPFEDGKFDVVIASDLLEHISPEDRGRAINELCRVTRRRAVIACPAGKAALEADRRLADRLRARGRPIPPWLAEHLENGFPDRALIAREAGRFGHVRMFDNEALGAHQRLVMAELTPLPAILLRLACRPLELLLRNPRTRSLARRGLLAVRGGDRAPAYRVVATMDVATTDPHQPGRQTRE
jgi:SAM-dependent methyltransferase